jgi:Mn-dependent DtxR family transcriptional regulator
MSVTDNEILAAIDSLADTLLRPPSLTELAAHLGLSRPSTFERVRRLRRLGLIEPAARYRRGVVRAGACSQCGRQNHVEQNTGPSPSNGA